MEPQLILVGDRDPTLSDDNIILTFDRDDMTNTTLRICGSHLPSYVVSTSGNTTKICAGSVVFATMTRRTFRPDQITFFGLQPMGLKSWLKAPLVGSFPLSFRACGRRFKWRENLAQQLVLSESGRSGDHLAWFSRGRRVPWDPSTSAAYLVVKHEAVEIQMRDMIVLSCLLAERKRRELIAKNCLGRMILDVMVLGF